MVPVDIRGDATVAVRAPLVTAKATRALSVVCTDTVPPEAPVVPPDDIDATTSIEGYIEVLHFLTPDTFFGPVSPMHSMASADVVFVAPVPPAGERVLTVRVDY